MGLAELARAAYDTRFVPPAPDAIVHPKPGEAVVEVPQSYQARTGICNTLHGKLMLDLGPHLSKDVRWIVYDPQRDPGTGYGLIVIRNGKCYRGPSRWDSGD